jgi:hypothetical protein
MQNFDHNIGFGEKRQFFRRKSSKIAENCDHNIDPRWGEFSPIGSLCTLGSFFSSTQNDNAMTTALQCINSLKPYTLAGFEHRIFCSVGAMTTMPRLHPWQLCQFSKKYRNSPYICTAFSTVTIRINLVKNGLGYILGDFFLKLLRSLWLQGGKKSGFFSVPRVGHICIFTYLTDLLLLIHFFGQ